MKFLAAIIVVVLGFAAIIAGLVGWMWFACAILNIHPFPAVIIFLVVAGVLSAAAALTEHMGETE